MSKAGRLARGKDNFEKHKFMNNSETLEYMATLEKPKAEKPKEKENAKPAE